MKQIYQKYTAVLLVLVQLFVLFPFGTMQAQATAESPVPELNKTIVGTVTYQSFNFLGDNETGEDGTDYTSTFYYTDDYFARSAMNPAIGNTANDAKQSWTALEDPSMAACSAAFALASFTTNDKNVLGNTRPSYNNTDYSNKDANARSFLTQCDFNMASFQQTNYLRPPQQDTIGYVLCSKTIRVWDETAGRNKDYTLVAVGVRGAGYGAEWANNVTIGDPDTNALAANKRHFGFDQSAQTICADIERYLAAQNITGEVKYWVAGFSRAAAVANLVAGYLTHDSAKYQTQQKDVFGYTYEAPQAASTDENALDYKNIHNILNAMDMVPKVSPTAFGHQRLGVDYAMPYYGNTSSTKNSEYYNRMWNVIQTMITTDDPLYTAVDPNNYPYNRALPLYTIGFWKLVSDAGSGDLATNFGTEEYTGNDKIGGGRYMIDQFIDSLINVFLTSPAWDRGMTASQDPLVHRTRFIQYYQEDFRTVMGYLLDFSGPAFLGLAKQLISAVGEQIAGFEFSIRMITKLVNNFGFALSFLNFYNNKGQGTYPVTYALIGWNGDSYKEKLIEQAKPVVRSTLQRMTNGYTSRDRISESTMLNAMDHLVELVVELYGDELYKYNSQYFGTTLHWLNTILCTHEQETVLSWIMSLDENHMNRNCRTITIPRNCTAKLLEFREGYEAYDGTPTDAEAKAPVVAQWDGTVFTTKDARITYAPSSSADYIIVRYPAALDLRMDILSDADQNLGNIGLDDYRTSSETDRVSVGESQYRNVPLRSNATSSGFQYVTLNSTYSDANARNSDLSAYGTLEAGDTLHIISHGTDTYSEKMTYDLLIDQKPTNVVADYAAKTVVAQSFAGTLPAGADSRFTVEGGTLYWNGAPGSLTVGSTGDAAADLTGVSSASSLTNTATAPTVSITTRKTYSVVPASSVYFDDSFAKTAITGNPGDSAYSLDTERLDSDTQTNGFWFKFRGSRIDVYCTTDSDNGYISVGVFDENRVRMKNPDGSSMVKTIRSYSEDTRYNVPTVSFDGLDASAVHYLKLSATAGSNYKLDGIRVYNPTNDSARFLNVRSLLLDAEAAAAADGVSGVAYSVLNGDTEQTETYTKNGPKSEVYLENGESISFHVDGNCDVAVGLSAPDNQGSGVLTVTSGTGTKTETVSSVVDTYFDITPNASNDVVITNDSDVMVAVTNIRLTPRAGIILGAAPIQVTEGLKQYAKLFRSLAAAQPEETAAPIETVAPEPTPEQDPTSSLAPDIAKLLSSFVHSLFRSFSQLFRP